MFICVPTLVHLVSTQVVTTLKNTAKPVTDLPFPAITICGSGLHMGNVEKKLGENFAQWRTKNRRNNDTKEAIEEDIKDYMWSTFQIKPEEESESKTKPANILDILDTMIAPNVEASVASNGLRENVFACKESEPARNDLLPVCIRVPTQTFICQTTTTASSFPQKSPKTLQKQWLNAVRKVHI